MHAHPKYGLLPKNKYANEHFPIKDLWWEVYLIFPLSNAGKEE